MKSVVFVALEMCNAHNRDVEMHFKSKKKKYPDESAASIIIAENERISTLSEFFV